MDVASALDVLVPAAVYTGSLTANTQEAYEGVQWGDGRAKPGWSDLSAVVIMPPVSETLEGMFIQAVEQYSELLTPEEEASLWLLKAGITEMLRFNRLAAARAAITLAVIPGALEPVRQAMLGVIP